MNYNVPIYNPIEERGEDYFYPSNEASYYLIQIQHIWNDIYRWLCFLKDTSDAHGRILIGKSIITECISLDTALTRFVNLILRGSSRYEVTPRDLSTLKSLWKPYKTERKTKIQVLERVRNKIAAHRDPIPLDMVASIIDTVDFKAILEFLSPVAPLFNFAKDLNIYEWTKVETDETGTKVQAFIGPFRLNSG